MERFDGQVQRPAITRRIVTAGLLVCCLAIAASSQSSKDPREGDRPDAEFQIARVIYATTARAGSRGILQPMWAVDYPLADAHFLPALRRYTRIDVAEDSRHLQLTDERLFQYPFLWLQQPGFWNPSDADIAQLREYLLRGGFLMLDDFHGRDWDNFEYNIRRVLPEFEIVDIPQDDPIMQIFFNIDQRTQIPGDRHLRRSFNGETVVQMEGPPHWRGIYDDRGRLMVVANHNMDIGDAWEHADDPGYPLPMTAFAYQLGVNYVLYAMTH
jgi:Domain of unknown function (DUF4159)